MLVALSMILAVLSQETSRDEDRPTLEEFRRQLIELREKQQAELVPIVAEKVERLRNLLASASGGRRPGGFKTKLDHLQSEFDELPPEAASILLGNLDTEFSDTPAGAEIAKVMHRALKKIGTRSVTAELAEMARSERLSASTVAIDLLAYSDDPIDAAAALASLWNDPPHIATGSQLAHALMIQGGQAAFDQLAAVLEGPASPRIDWALEALASHPSSEAELVVSNFLSRGPAAVRGHVDALLLFYFASPKSFGDEQAKNLVEQIGSESIPSAEDRAILSALPDLKRQITPVWMTTLRDRSASKRGTKMAQALLVCLANCGDRRARKELLADSTSDLVHVRRGSQNKVAEAKLLRERGQLLLDLREFDSAASEFEKAYKLYPANSKEQLSVGIDQARAYSRGNRIRKAYTMLNSLRLTETQKLELSSDADFAVLVESSQYGHVLKPL